MRRGGARGVAGVADQVLMHAVAVSMAGRELLVIFFHGRQHGAGEAAQHSCGRDASGVLPRSQGVAVYEPCEDVREQSCKPATFGKNFGRAFPCWNKYSTRHFTTW